jgi:urea carboxylase
MIYSEPRYLPGGDRYMLVEFGNEMNLELNFMAQGLAAAIVEARIAGIIETAPCFASMLVHYEPELIGFDDLRSELSKLVAGLGPSDALELESRLFYLPAVYLDPWTRACVEDYQAKISPETADWDLMVELNGLRDTDDFVRVHSGTEYWVASLGFWPGLPFMMALDPRAKMTAPKYNPPRTWTPGGAIGLGGASTAIYPEQLPGGYQIFARTPVPIWDRAQRFEAFAGSICLFRPGDRVRFVPCSVEEFEAIEREVADGTYQYNMVGYGKFSVALYKSWTASLGARRTS